MESGKTESLEMNFSSAAAVGGSEELTTECHQIRRISTEKSFKNPQSKLTILIQCSYLGLYFSLSQSLVADVM